MARNKCKELYDKLDKGDWKVEDVSISTITIKDLEFTKPTMNARENLTVESLQKPNTDKSVEELGQKMDFQQFADFINSEFKKKILAKVDSNGTQVRLEVYPNEKKQIEEILKDICGQNGWKYEKITRNLHYTYYVTYDSMNESKEKVEVEFKKTPEDDGSSVIAFFPQTMHDGSCNPGNIMSYEHNGQHGEASIDYYHDCTNCFEEDYASLLHELEGIYDDCELVVVEK